MEDMIAELKQAIAIDGGNAEYFNTLGYIYLARTKEYKLAVQCFQKAIELFPDFGLAKGNLAFALHFAGEPTPLNSNYRPGTVWCDYGDKDKKESAKLEEYLSSLDAQ